MIVSLQQIICLIIYCLSCRKSSEIIVLCMCKARRQEYKYELGCTEQQEFSLKVSTDRGRECGGGE